MNPGATSQHLPKLILTGGTLSSSRDEKGLLVPSATALEECIKRVGFDTKTMIKPYTIDSIDFDMRKHYRMLRDTVIAALDEGATPVICGGTDSLIWYSTLLTEDLMRRGRLQVGSDEKVIFLSAMRDFEKAPEHVENILRAGQVFAQQHVSGGFAVCAEHDDGGQLAVHDVRNHFDKVSSSLTRAFRSDMPIAYISGSTVHFNVTYNPPPRLEPGESHYARIAPPLLMEHDSGAMQTYMKAMGMATPPVDGILIEGFPGITGKAHRTDRASLADTVRWLKSRGVRVVFCNPLRYDANHLEMRPVMGTDPWQAPRLADMKTSLEKAGAEFTTAMPKEAYIHMMLTTEEATSRSSVEYPSPRPLPQKVIGIRYVPDSGMMHEAINTLAPHTKNLAFSTLPHNVMPDSISPALEQHAANTHYTAAFDYNGVEFPVPDGTHREGGNPNPYDAGQKTGKYTTIHSGSRLVRSLFNR